MYTINQTHDPALCSWVESAEAATTDFPIQNLPFGVFRRAGSGEQARIGVAIGDQILDICACVRAGLLDHANTAWCETATLNALLAIGMPAWQSLRLQISALLAAGSPAERMADQLLVAQHAAELLLPAAIGDYTDAYASIDHATNVGRLFRPDTPLLPNYKHMPIAYHGRASSLVVSGTPITRPCGQIQDGEAAPIVAPTRRLDYEAEIGVLIGPGNPLGTPIAIAQVPEHMFGLCLVNDWSARDMQRWEYQPLGPFLSKSFATSIGPWVVTSAALAPFQAPAFARPDGDPQPLPYLFDPHDQQYGGLTISVEVRIHTAAMRAANLPPHILSRSPMNRMYWTLAQIVAHHTSNGCNLRPGDLIASGTISGPDPGEQGCLLELTRAGREPVLLPNGEARSFLADGDEIAVAAYAERAGFRRIGFGTCCGRVAGG